MMQNDTGHECPDCGGSVEARTYPLIQGTTRAAHCQDCRRGFTLLRDQGDLILQ